MIDTLGGSSTLAFLQRHAQNSATQKVAETHAPAPKMLEIPLDKAEFDTRRLEIEAFTRGVKGANEYIGALQSADVTLKKMSKSENTEAMSALAEASSFMGKKLFDRELVNEIGSERFSLTLRNPAPFGEEAKEYITQKRGEISGLLAKVSDAISNSNRVENPNNYNFEEFDANAFMKLF